MDSPSLFELPASRGARALRIATVLTLDAVLAGAGIAMIVSYFDARAEAARPLPGEVSAPAPGPQAQVEVSPPRVVRPGDPTPRPVDVPPVRSGPTPAPSSPRPAPSPAPGPGKPGPSGTDDPGSVLGGVSRRPDAGGLPVPSPIPTPVPVVTPDAAPPPPPPPPPVAPPDAAVEPPPGPGPVEDAEQALASGVQRTVEGHMGQVRRCWENAAKSSSDTNLPEGTIEVEFTVLPNGSPSRVHLVQNATGSDQLATCVVALVNSWSFPVHDGDPVVFVWPFLFKASR